MRFVVFEEGDAWVAMCLERYVGAQGRTLEEVKRNLRTVYAAERDGALRRCGAPFGDIPESPRKYHDMWDDPAVARGTITDIADGTAADDAADGGMRLVA